MKKTKNSRHNVTLFNSDVRQVYTLDAVSHNTSAVNRLAHQLLSSHSDGGTVVITAPQGAVHIIVDTRQFDWGRL